MQQSKRRESFALSLSPVLVLGGLLAAGFFALIITGPLDFPLLRRYCLSHPVAIASVSLFFVGLVTLTIKWFQSLGQRSAIRQASSALERFITDGQDVLASQRSDWLLAHWRSLTGTVRESRLGVRILRTLEMQSSRGRSIQLENDLQSFADSDADRQHESYSLVRIINWSMPMLGFLGTVLGISRTLGQLDTEMLATQQQDAMNQLTAGLYVAFDTTAIALILTVFLMFVQFAVSRIEMAQLSVVDSETSRLLIGFLSSDPHDSQTNLLNPIRDALEEVTRGIKSLVSEQVTLWTEAMQSSHTDWSEQSAQTAVVVEQHIRGALGECLQEHVASLQSLQDESTRQMDHRWQQWQTTLSEQARTIHAQQREVARQAEAMQKLIDSTVDLQRIEDSLGDRLASVQSAERIEEATKYVGEAVAVLATSLERAGVFRGQPTRPRKLTRPQHDSDSPTSSERKDAA